MKSLPEQLIQKINDRTAIIAVVGLGYVGLPTAVQFAKNGFTVIGADNNKNIVRLINSGKCHLNDLNIGERVKEVVNSGKLIATENTTYATERADIVLIIVPTPLLANKTPDLYPIISAGKDIACALMPGKLVILESTVYPGLTEEILVPILEASQLGRPVLEAGVDFGLAHVPERYNPGDSDHGIYDVVRVVGAINPEWLKVTSLLYRQIVTDVCEVRDIKTAEAAKIIENVQRDLNIALMNEFALIFEKVGIDVMDVIKAAQTKWNFNTFYPGMVGGHCLTKDGLLLVEKAKTLGYHSKIILAGRAVNDSMPYHVLDLLIDALNEHERAIKNSKIVVMGMSYKEGIGDVRESPAVVLITELERRGADVWVIDPYVESTKTPAASGMYEIMKGADAVVIMTAHKEFKELSFTKIQEGMRTPILIDGRRMIDPKIAKKLEFTYRGVGARNNRGGK